MFGVALRHSCVMHTMDNGHTRALSAASTRMHTIAHCPRARESLDYNSAILFFLFKKLICARLFLSFSIAASSSFSCGRVVTFNSRIHAGQPEMGTGKSAPVRSIDRELARKPVELINTGARAFSNQTNKISLLDLVRARARISLDRECARLRPYAPWIITRRTLAAFYCLLLEDI